MPWAIFPPLEYPLTREFEWKWASTAGYSLSFLVIVLLSLLNTALVGYDTVTEFHSDFNVTQTFWFDGFIPNALKQRKPGTLCSPQLFSTGDPMGFNSSVFSWKVDAAYQTKTEGSGYNSGLFYKGAPLDSCDITYMELLVDIKSWSLEASIYMTCLPAGTWVLGGVTTLRVSALSRGQTYQTISGYESAPMVQDLLSLSGLDLWSQLYRTSAADASGITTIFIQAFVSPCPISFSRNASSACARSLDEPTGIHFIFTTITAATDSNDRITVPNVSPLNITNGSMNALDPAVYVPTLNFLHLALAAARVDIGNSAPSNFLTNRDVLDATLEANLPVPIGAPPDSTPARSLLYEAWKSQAHPITNKTFPPISILGPSILETVFACRFYRLKSVGSLIVSVLVATLSMFSTIWALSIWAATFFAKRGNPRANQCEACAETRKPYEVVSGGDAEDFASISSTIHADSKH